MNLFWKGSAYTILCIHMLFTFFILLMPFAIILGKWVPWAWIQEPMLRTTHILLLSFVIIEVILSIPCFLTVMENGCRKKSNMPLYSTGFFDYWVEELFSIPYNDRVFMMVFGLISIASFILYFVIPPASF